MSEELETAKTNEVDLGSHADAESEVNESEFDDAQGEVNEEEAQEAEKSEEAEKPKQDNSENARRRREAERLAELKRVEEQAIIKATGGINPFTQEPITDSADVEEFLLMKEIEKEGGDPVEDYAKFAKKKQREEFEKKSKEEQAKEWFTKDREDFASKFPEVKIDSLVKNESFQIFAKGKVGNLPLADIYNDFLKVTAEYEKAAKLKAQQLIANKQSSPGSLGSSETSETEFFTREQVSKMSREEVHKHYDKIRESMNKWNN